MTKLLIVTIFMDLGDFLASGGRVEEDGEGATKVKVRAAGAGSGFGKVVFNTTGGVSFSLGFVEPSFSFLFGSVDTAFEVEAERGLFTGEEEEEEEEEDDDLLGISNS